MLYRLIRFLASVSLREFFRRISFVGAPAVESGPVIVVANHPNFMLDTLLVASAYQRPLSFIAKATLFEVPVLGAVLRGIGSVPIHRRQDGGNQQQNEISFAAVVDALVAGGAIAIFPEGVSLGERSLAPVRTGAARMALQAEAARSFSLGLRIQPVGLTYTDLKRFRGAVTISRGEPFTIADLRSDYERDASECVRRLTDRVEEAIRAVTVEIREAAHATLVEKVARVFEVDASAIDDRERMQTIVRHVEANAGDVHGQSQELRERIDLYVDLADAALAHGSIATGFRVPQYLMVLVVPFVGIGYATHYPIYRLIGTLVERYADHPVYVASYKFAFGMVLFPLWYLIIASVFGVSFGASAALIALCVLCLSGALTNRHAEDVRLLLLNLLWPGRHRSEEVLKILREQLASDLRELVPKSEG